MGENNGVAEGTVATPPVETAKVVELSPAITPPGKKLLEEERLAIENCYLKIQNAVLQMQGLDHQKAQLVETVRALQKEMEELKAKLSAKYGTPIERTTVQADGTIGQ
jgi:hypothetical protein